MNAYGVTAWGTFFAAEVGAAAALTGLLFVAAAIKLARILSFPKLPARAGETLAVLLLVVVTSSLALVPQAAGALGIEVTAVALLFGGVPCPSRRSTARTAPAIRGGGSGPGWRSPRRPRCSSSSAARPWRPAQAAGSTGS
ncbi:MAG: hypothetical protein ACLPUO_03780 [Streptosporangiaceae bacterium]|jgi:modulator of FtsH protease